MKENIQDRELSLDELEEVTGGISLFKTLRRDKEKADRSLHKSVKLDYDPTVKKTQKA